MNKYLRKLFLNRSLSYKFNIVFALVTVVPIIILAYASYRIIDSRLLKDSSEKINMGLKAAWSEFYSRGEQMKYGMLQAASEEDIKKAIKAKNKGRLKDTFLKWKGRRPYVDIWIISDNKGKVIARLNSDLAGDVIELNGLIEKALTTGTPQISTEVIPGEVMEREGELHSQVAPLIDPKNISERYTSKIGDEMALMVVTPVIDNHRGPIGAIVTGDIINNDPYLPAAIADKFPWLFVSIALDNLRIATDIKDSNNLSISGTFLPPSILTKIRSGNSVVEEWTVGKSDKEYISIFEPIKDNKGKIIGSMDVAIQKSRLWDIQRENRNAIVAVTVIGLIMALIVSLITANRITRPLTLLKQKTLGLANTDMGAGIKVDVSTQDELYVLIHIFDKMNIELKKRTAEKEQNLMELRNKHKELEESNEKFRTTNEKLEISYEEIQAQTEELTAANEELRVVNEELGAKNKQLLEAYDRLKEGEGERMRLMEKVAQTEKLSSLGELVAGVAHELNNPLTAIMGFSDLLLEKDLPDGIKDRMKMIHEASQRSKHIIDNLLTFTRSHKPNSRPDNLNRIIFDTIELKKLQMKVENINLELNLDPFLPHTMLDEYQIHEVFLNLINNACDAIVEKGGGGKLTISSSHEGDLLRATISDTGRGIPDHLIKKIFDPFFTTKDVGKGTGLGLSISYGIIKGHEGNLYVTSAAGKGTTFTVELPITKTPEHIEANQHSRHLINWALPSRKVRILVLDDEPHILNLLKEALSDSGFHVNTAVTGDEALKLVKDAPYDIIISDIKMPGMDGKEFYNRLKDIRPEVTDKVIFISGDSMCGETQDFLRDSGRPFLKKPFTIKGLKEAISRHIEKTSSGDVLQDEV